MYTLSVFCEIQEIRDKYQKGWDVNKFINNQIIETIIPNEPVKTAVCCSFNTKICCLYY